MLFGGFADRAAVEDKSMHPSATRRDLLLRKIFPFRVWELLTERETVCKWKDFRHPTKRFGFRLLGLSHNRAACKNGGPIRRDMQSPGT